MASSAVPQMGQGLVASLVAVVLITGPNDHAHAQFREALKDRLGRTIGHVQQQGDRTIVLDRCLTRLGWVVHGGTKKGTYETTGQRIAQSHLPFMLLLKPSPSCPPPEPQ